VHTKDKQKLPLNSDFPYRVSLGFQVSHPRNLPLFGVASIECEPDSCVCKCDNAATNSSGCTFDTLSNHSSLVTVVTYLNLDVSESSSSYARAEHRAATDCPVGTCAIRVRNAAAGTDGRFRVVLRALIVGLNDWRTRWLRNGGLVRAGMGNV